MTSTCCGQTARTISIEMSQATLTFAYCERCESRRWLRDGRPVELAAVKADAAATWNRKVAAA
jgi:hypothetical protein